MGREDGLAGCCAFCLCPVEVTPDKKQGATRKLILEKFYTDFINNPVFNQLKLRKNGESEEDKPADNWTICGECCSHVNRLLGSKAKVDKVEMEVRRLQKRIVEEMRGLLEEVDGMCGDMVMIEGILTSRDVNSDAATGRGMRVKCKEFRDKIINILRDLRNFQQEVGVKLVSSDVPMVKVKKATKVTTFKSSKSTKRKVRKPSIIRSKSQPPTKRIAPPVTVPPKLEKEEDFITEVKIEAEPTQTQDDDNDRDDWHWGENTDNNDDVPGPQSPVQPQQNISPTRLLPKGIMAMLIAKSKKKRKRTSHLHYAKKRKTPKQKTVKSIKKPEPGTSQQTNYNDDQDSWHGNEDEINDDDGPELPGGPVPNSSKTDVPFDKEPSNEETSPVVDPEGQMSTKMPGRYPSGLRFQTIDPDEDEISSSESDTSDEDFDPENKALIEFRDIKLSRRYSTFRRNFIVRINQHSTISTSKTLPPNPTDDPRRPHKFYWKQSKNKFFVDDVEVHFLENLQDNPDGDKYGLGCSLCEYTIYSSGMVKTKENIEDYIFDHVLGKHFKVYRCNQCQEDKHFGDISLWRTHQRSHAMEYTCEICERPMCSVSSLKTHRWTHLSQEEKEDPSNEHYKPEYVRKPVTGKNFICEVCGKGFRIRKNLKEHEETHKSVEERDKTICEICGMTVLAKVYQYHKKKWCKPPRDLRCHICGDGVKNVNGLNKHLVKMHPEVRTFECDVCGKKFKTKPQVRNHKETHKEERDHLCRFCGKGFKQSKNCNRHEKSCGGGGKEDEGRGVRNKEGGLKQEEDREEQPGPSFQQSSWTPL